MNLRKFKEVEDLVCNKLSNNDFNYINKKLNLCTSRAINIDSNYIVLKNLIV